jgi:hypothetical protein
MNQADDPLPGGETASERGKRASFDPQTGEVHGSGSGAGGGGNPREDYDQDPMAGAGADPVGGPKPVDEATRGPVDKHQGHYG